MRLSVQHLLEVLAGDPSQSDLRHDYPDLDEKDIRQALAFAALMLADQEIRLNALGL